MNDVMTGEVCAWLPSDPEHDAGKPAPYEALDPTDTVGWLPMCIDCAEDVRRAPGNAGMSLRTLHV